MSLFGFAEATSVAAWTAVTLVCLPLNLMHSKSAELRINSPAMPKWVPRLGIQFSLWLVIGACWVVAMFYLTKVSVGDSWQLITGVALFLAHALLVRAWNNLFWKLHMPRGAFMTGMLVLLTAIGLIICSFVNQTNAQSLYLIPGIIFSIYTAFILANLVGNYMYLPKTKKHHHHKSHHHQKEQQEDDDYVMMPEERGRGRGGDDGMVVHIPRR